MSIPPKVIKVKRKRSEDGGDVPYLRIEQSAKRHRGDGIFYRRHGVEVDVEQAAAPRRPPVIHHSVPPLRFPITNHSTPKDEPTLPRKVRAASGVKGSGAKGNAPKAIGGPALESPGLERPLKAVPARRFHLSRSFMAANIDKHSRYDSPAVFVERKKRQKVTAQQIEKHAPELAAKNDATPPDSPPLAGTVDRNDDERIQSLPALPLRPRTKRVDNSLMSLAEADKFFNRWGSDMDETAHQIEEYTMRVIAENLAQMDMSSAKAKAKPADPAQTSVLKKPAEPMKFKPKAPAKRYFERHPEVATTSPQVQVLEDRDMDYESEDDENYITETYYRVDNTSVVEAIKPEEVGVLVLGSETAEELFYEGESDDEDDPNDEDENAEDYYTNDYPDEELDSDDDFGSNPHPFLANDLEDELGFDDAYLENLHRSAEAVEEFGLLPGERLPESFYPTLAAVARAEQDEMDSHLSHSRRRAD